MKEPEQPDKLSPLFWLIVSLLPLLFSLGELPFRATTASIPAMLFWLAVPAVLFFLMLRCLPLIDRAEGDISDTAMLRSAIKTAPLHRVELLVERVKHTEGAVQKLAAARLIQLAGTASAEQMFGLLIEQRQALYSCITLGNALEHPELVHELLTMVERVRDQHALPFVESLATATSYLPNTDGAIERAKAVQALLEAEAARTVSKAVLLRSAEPDDALLRPAGNDATLPAEALLRPAVTDE